MSPFLQALRQMGTSLTGGKPASGDDRKTLARLTSGARTGTKSDSARRD